MKEFENRPRLLKEYLDGFFEKKNLANGFEAIYKPRNL